MKSKKWLLLSIVFFLIVVSVFLHYTIGFPLVIETSKAESSFSVEKGENVKLLSDFNFSEGDWAAYIIFNNEDNNSANRLLSLKAYKTQDTSLLNNMKKDWIFDCTGSDMATIQSHMYLFNEGVLKYKSGIVLEKNLQGFQSPQCGWVQSKETDIIYNYCKEFKPIYWPILIL